MKPYVIYISIIFLAITYVPTIYAQQYAVTEDGREVVLYGNGTWEYLRPHYLEETTQETGTKAHILIDKEIVIILNNGFLEDFSVLTDGYRLYDEMSGKIKRIGHYNIEYEFHTERLKKIGEYTIEYDFLTDRVKKIGNYPVEYDFHSEKISRIGNTRFKYSFFNGKLTDISGHTPGLKITIY